MRAAHTQTLVASVRKLAVAERTTILDAVTADRLTEIESVFPMFWLPMTAHMALSDAIRDTVGPERNRRIWRSTMDSSYQRPLLQGFVSGAVGLFGMTPASLFRQGPRIYGQLTRDLGAVTFDPVGENGGTVYLRGFPAKDFRFICYIEGLAGCLESTISLTRAIGEVTPLDADEKRGDVSYRVRWERRTEGGPGG